MVKFDIQIESIKYIDWYNFEKIFKYWLILNLFPPLFNVYIMSDDRVILNSFWKLVGISAFCNWYVQNSNDEIL